jgi:hypothetical protein
MRHLRYEPDAGRYSVSETLDRFVPVAVWDQLRQPGHQLIYGGKGTGKTMLMRRLSWPAMLREPAFFEDTEFVAFFCDLRGLDPLASLFRDEEYPDLDYKTRIKVASLCATALAIESIAQDLADAAGFSDHAYYDALAAGIAEAANEILGIAIDKIQQPRPQSIGEVLVAARRVRDELTNAITDPEELQKWIPNALRSQSLEQTLRFFRHRVQDHGLNVRIGFLFDQYEFMPSACQSIVDPLLRRQCLSEFFTLVAARPYSFGIDPRTVKIPREDYHLTIVEYLPDQFDSYKKVIAAIWLRLNNENIETRLEGGVDYLAQLSSRSIRLFLSLSRRAKELSDGSGEIARSAQEAAGIEDSNVVRDLLAGIDGIPADSLTRLLDAMRKRAQGLGIVSRRDLPGQIEFESDDLALHFMEAPAVTLLRKAFEDGIFQFTTRTDASAITLPKRCSIAPILGPAFGGVVLPAVRLRFPVGEISSALNRPLGKPGPIPGTNPINIKRAFLSIPFDDLPEPQAAQAAFVRIFAERGVHIEIGKGIGLGFINDLKDQIKSTDATLLEVSDLKPNIVLEMGLTLGLWNRIIPVMAKGSLKDPETIGYPFLMAMGQVLYDLDDKHLREMRDEVLQWGNRKVSGTHVVHHSLDGGTKLRINQSPRTLTLYYPPDRRGLWGQYDKSIQVFAEKTQHKFLVVSSSPHKKTLPVLDNLVWCISQSDRVIIDTSGKDGPDLYGCFALGFALGCSKKGSLKQIWRIEERGRAHPEKLSMWPTDRYFTWGSADDLLRILAQVIPN